MTLIRKVVGLVLVFGGGCAAAIGVAWIYLASSGSEWDFCNGSECVPAYQAASIPIAAGLALVFVGVILVRLHSPRDHSHPPPEPGFARQEARQREESEGNTERSAGS